MKYDLTLTLKTEVDTYAKQSFTLAVRDGSSFKDALDELRCNIEVLPSELQVINKHTIGCIFRIGEKE